VSQRARVLAALRSRGAHGVCSVDFLLPDIVDGGKPITRLAARMLELREDGHEIQVIGDRHGCAVYRLMRDAQDQPRPNPMPTEVPEGFAIPENERTRPRSAIFGWDEEAA
jgi:hypothetical protein